MVREDAEQEALMRWTEWMSGRMPELRMLFHIPNGGKRNASEAAHLKRLGVKAGVPDLFLPVPYGGKHGLFIEMKAGKNKPTENQNRWIEELKKQGYAVCVCYGWEDAANVILQYFGKGGCINDRKSSE